MLSPCCPPACSLARCRGMRAQREMTLLRWSLALGAEKQRSLGGEFRGPHFPVARGKNQGEIGGRGGQLTRGLWLCPGKNNREGPSEGPPPTTTHMHIQSTERGAQYILSSNSMFQQSQKNLSCSRVFCIKPGNVNLISFNGFFDLQNILPPQERPHHAGG